MIEYTAADLGIPTLDLSMQALDLPQPITKWGVIGRTRPMPGTYHFYCDPSKWSALAARPHRLETVGCAAAVEPNFPTRLGEPIARLVGDICRKRTLARAWQDAGIRIVVDLAVDSAGRELNYLGVPRGWGAYATRCRAGYEWSWGLLEADHARALDHAHGQPFRFTVFGGGPIASAKCLAAGWDHVPDALHQLAIHTR